MSGREIREELKALHVSTAGCVEKADFVAKLREARAALKSRRVEAPATAPGPAAEAETPPLRGGGGGGGDGGVGGGGGGESKPAAKANPRPRAPRKDASGKAGAKPKPPPPPPLELWDLEASEAGDGQLSVRVDVAALAANATAGDPSSQYWLAQLCEAGAVDAEGNVTVPVDVVQAREREERKRERARRGMKRVDRRTTRREWQRRERAENRRAEERDFRECLRTRARECK